MTVLDDYAKRVEKKVDNTNLLGRLCWYTLSEMRVPHAEVVQLLKDAGITTGHPRDPKDTDVFKRVCSAVKYLRVPTKDPDIFENYRLVEFRDDTTVTRRVVRDRVNNAGRKLDMTQLFDIIFDRETSDLVFKPINNFKFKANSVGANIRDQVIDEYYLWKGCLSAYHVREWMRHYIMHLGATMVRSGGGVYFVRELRRPEVEALESIGEALVDFTISEFGKVEFHSLPLIDDEKQRQMIQRAFEAETIDAIDDLIGEITTISKSKKKITQDRYTGLVEQYTDLMSRTQEYEELLEQKLASTGTRLSIFSQSLLNLRKNIKEDS